MTRMPKGANSRARGKVIDTTPPKNAINMAYYGIEYQSMASAIDFITFTGRVSGLTLLAFESGNGCRINNHSAFAYHRH
jgi:hypothetical protein